MIVDEIAVSSRPGDRVARSATLIRDADGAAQRLDVVVPADFSPPQDDDATGVLPYALLLAMRLGEPLEVRGRVDSGLLARIDDIRDYFVQCGLGRLTPVEVRTAGTLPADGPPAPLIASCFSRGHDSTYQAARGRCAGGPLDALVFADRFEPLHDDAVRAQEIALAGDAAAALGLPLIVVEAPLRAYADELYDWDDAAGTGLAWVGHALSGGLGRFVIAASHFPQALRRAVLVT